MPVILDFDGQRLELQDHAAEALGQLAAGRGTVAATSLAGVLLAEQLEHGAVTLTRAEQIALLAVLGEVPPDVARPDLRNELGELRQVLDRILNPE